MKDRKTAYLSVHSQIATAAGSGPGGSQEPVTIFGPPMWVQGSKHLGSSTAFLRALAECQKGSGAARIQMHMLLYTENTGSILRGLTC